MFPGRQGHFHHFFRTPKISKLEAKIASFTMFDTGQHDYDMAYLLLKFKMACEDQLEDLYDMVETHLESFYPELQIERRGPLL